MTSPIKRAGVIIGILAAAAGIFFAASVAAPSASMAQEGKPHLILELKDGVVDVELLPEIAPKHVERVVTLAEQGFYDGVVFHRVIEGFMAQTGDPTGTGMGGSDLPDVVAEFSATPYARGIVGAARSQNPDSFNSQFFISYDMGARQSEALTGQYTVFGKVVAGMEFVDMVKKGPPAQNGMVQDPDRIISAKIEYR